MPTLRHPDLPAGQVIEAVASRVPVLEKSGWVVIDEPDNDFEDDGPLGSNDLDDDDADSVADTIDPALAGTHEE